MKSSIWYCAPESGKVTHQMHEKAMEKMENALILWIDVRSQRKVPVDQNVIQDKAKSL